jgi:hypothetical protein
MEAPALVDPDELAVGSVAAPAIDAADAAPWLFLRDRRQQGAGHELTVERERVPRLDGRHP